MKKQSRQPQKNFYTHNANPFKGFLLLATSIVLSQISQAQWQGTSPVYYTTGNAGIGTSTPGHKLTVAVSNSTNVNDGISITRGYNDNVFGLRLKSDGAGNYRNAITVQQTGVGEVEAITIDALGRVGIGTTTPAAKLHVNSTMLAEYTGATTDLPNIRLYNSTCPTNVSGEHRADIYLHNSTGQLTFRNVTGKGYNFLNNSATGSMMVIDESGNVGINTTNTYGYKLAVNGSAIFTEARVKLYGNWPDYVFGKKYNLLPLKDLENYISANNHLPNIPSAAEVQKDGINLGDMNAKLLEKIEELTLYIIELKKENEQIKDEIKKLSK